MRQTKSCHLLSWDEWEVGRRHLQTLWRLSERDNGINLAEPMRGSYVNKMHKENECVAQNPEQQPQSEEAQRLAAHAPNTDNACCVPTDLRLREIQAYKTHDSYERIAVEACTRPWVQSSAEEVSVLKYSTE